MTTYRVNGDLTLSITVGLLHRLTWFPYAPLIPRYVTVNYKEIGIIF